MNRGLLALLFVVVFAATASATLLWTLEAQTGDNTWTNNAFAVTQAVFINDTSIANGLYDHLIFCYRGGGGATCNITGASFCESDTSMNCTGDIMALGSEVYTTAGGEACYTFTNVSIQINGSLNYSYRDYAAVSGANSRAYKNSAANGMKYIAGNYTGITAWKGTLNSLPHSLLNISGTTVGVFLNITPDYAAINESTTFTTSVTGNGSSATAWYWSFTYGGTEYFTASTQSTAQTLNYTGTWNATVIGTFGGTNYTDSTNITVAERPDANWTVSTTAPYMVYDEIQFNDTSDSPGGYEPMSEWYWDFGDGNTSSGTQNETNIYVLPGEYEVCLIVTDSLGLNSSEYCDNVTINGFAIDTFDESTYAAITNWTAAITNSSGCSYSTGVQNNTWVWSNFTDVCTGSVTITVSASGYVARTYYGVYNVGSYIDLDAYLLSSSAGIYPVFIVKNEQDEVIEGAILTFMKSISGAWVTVAQATTDVTGTTQVYLDPTVTYYLTVTASGYNTYTTSSFQPVSTTYVITLTTNTTFNFSDATGVFYMRINPDQPRIGSLSIIQFVCNDPWSNVQDFSLELTAGNGTQVYYVNSTASASCGIIEVNISGYAGNFTTYDEFTATGRVLRNGVNITTVKKFIMGGSWATGLGAQMGKLVGENSSFPGVYNATGDAIISKGTANILAFLIIAAATFGAATMFGWGAGVVGIGLTAFFVQMAWLPANLGALAVIFTIGAYLTGRAFR